MSLVLVQEFISFVVAELRIWKGIGDIERRKDWRQAQEEEAGERQAVPESEMNYLLSYYIL